MEKLSDSEQYLSICPSIVLKNYIPEQNKVIILHKYLGKITCVYNKNNSALRLCTGSLFLCSIEKEKSWFKINSIDILNIPQNCSIQDITFFHDIILLCIKILPSNVMVNELFDLLWNIFSNSNQLTKYGKKIVMLKIFLLFDLFPENKTMYQYALTDPFNYIETNEKQLTDFINVCWNQFYHEQKR